MFEAISGRSKSGNPRRRAATLGALGAHAAVIGALLLAARLQPAVQTMPEPLTPLHLPPRARAPVAVNLGRAPEAAPTHADPARRPQRHQPPPRANPAEPASAPREPEVEQPASTTPDAPNALGTGGGAQAEARSTGDARACPEGAICQGGEEIYLLSASMSRPRATCSPPTPAAPYSARALALEGRVVAQYVVHADGRAELIGAMNADAPPVYVEAVRQWLEQCTFLPAQIASAPRAVRVVQVFNFKPGR